MKESDIVRLRRELHKNPELSNNEFQTSERISDFFSGLNPDKAISLSNTGKAFVFNGNSPGKTVIFRAELDALPINENSSAIYKSMNKNVAHSCGHDGHMSIIAGLGKKIASNRPKTGRAVLLFQPAEEVEQGARDVVEDPNFKDIQPDYIFALHNIPGIELNKILIKEGAFAALFKWCVVKFSHSVVCEGVLVALFFCRSGRQYLRQLGVSIHGVHFLSFPASCLLMCFPEKYQGYRCVHQLYLRCTSLLCE